MTEKTDDMYPLVLQAEPVTAQWLSNDEIAALHESSLLDYVPYYRVEALVRDTEALIAAKLPLPRDQVEPLTDEEIAILETVPVFQGVDSDQLRWIVRRTEYEYGINDATGLGKAGVPRIRRAPPPSS